MRIIVKFRAYENELAKKPLYEQTVVSACSLSDFVHVEFRLCCPSRKRNLPSNGGLAAIIQRIKIPCGLCQLIHLGFDVTEYTCCPSDHDHLAEVSLSLRGRMDNTLTEVFSVPTGQAKWVCTQITGTFADFLRPQHIRLSLSLPLNGDQHVGKMTFLLPKRESVDLCFKPTLAAPQAADGTYTIFWSVCMDNTRAVFIDEDHEITKEIRVPLGRDYYARAVLLTILSDDQSDAGDNDSQETSVNGDESDNEACLCLTSKSSSKEFGSVDLTLAGGDKEQQNQIFMDSWPRDDRIDELTQPDHSTIAVRAVLEPCSESRLLLTFAIPCSSSLTRVLTSSIDCSDI